MNSDGRGQSRIARFWRRSYVGEYIGVISLASIYVLIQLFVEPFHQMFSLDDRSKAYPHALVQRVSEMENIIYAGVLPLIILVLWATIGRPGFHKGHVTILSFIEALLITSLITDIIKNAVGRARPDVIARCKPQPGAPAHELVTFTICTEKDLFTLHDGWRSFPSGHSSFAFAGLSFLSLFIGGQTHVLRPGTDLTRVILFMAPTIGAALIAVSRVADYRHDVYDVTAGSLLGLFVSHLMYRRHYRSLRHPKCDIPHPAKVQSSKKVSGKSRDEENTALEPSDFELEDTDDDANSETFPLNSVAGSRSK